MPGSVPFALGLHWYLFFFEDLDVFFLIQFTGFCAYFTGCLTTLTFALNILLNLRLLLAVTRPWHCAHQFHLDLHLLCALACH